MEKATYLFLLQDPGHSGEKSKKVSHTNDDDSARRITELVEDVGTPLLRLAGGMAAHGSLDTRSTSIQLREACDELQLWMRGIEGIQKLCELESDDS